MNNKGVTLTSLVVTVMVLLILASFAVYSGKSAIEESEKTAFQTELQIAQNKVNTIYEKMQAGDTSYNDVGKDISNVDVQQQEKIKTALSLSNFDGFKYFDQEELKKIDIDNIKQKMLINFNERKVISVNGLKIGDQIIYTQEQLKTGTYNNNFQNKNTTSPEFNLSKQIFGLTGKVTITDIKYYKNVGKGTIKYRLKGISAWNECIGNTFEVTTSGIYEVQIIDAANNESQIKEIELVLSNNPVLSAGMVPVVYNESTARWEKVDQNSGYWYDYGEKKWANVMLNDGLEFENDGKTIKNEGSMFVWIPRYAYKITEGYHSSTTGKIDVKFLVDTNNYTNDNAKIVEYNETTTSKYTKFPDGYVVHPAFTSNTAAGGWDKEIKGIWVAKFEAAYPMEDKTDIKEKAESGFYYPVFKGQRYSYNYISIRDIFTLAKEMCNDSNPYGIGEDSNSHMMKNSEWGACAYLATSAYGKNSEIYPNNVSFEGDRKNIADNPVYAITGYSADISYKETNEARGSEIGDKIGTSSAWYTEAGYNASTTGNIYGIYDMSGGNWEYILTLFLTGDDNSMSYSSSFYDSSSNKYLTIYPTPAGAETTINISTAYNAFGPMYGDALWETSARTGENDTQNHAWYNNRSDDDLNAGEPFFIRGCEWAGGESAGVFSFNDISGYANVISTFRAVLTVE